MAGNDDTYQREFYAPWPDLGKKLSQQWNEIRNNMSALAPVVRGVGLDSDGDYSDLNGLEKMSMQAIEVGKQDFHNKYRFHYNKTDDLLEMAYNDGTTVIPHWYTTWTINSDGHVTQQNTPTTASNVGGGKEFFKQKSGVDLEFRTLTASGVLTATQNTNTISLTSSAEANTYSSDQAAAPSGDAGVGVEIILSDSGKTGVDLPFKALKAGPNVVLSNTGTAIQIESTAQVVEFYGISVSATDSNPAYIEVHNLLFNREDFYITQQKTTPSNKTVIVNSISDPFNSTDYVAVIGDEMTGALSMYDGTEALPAITFTSDTSMGMRYRAANDLGFSVAGADVLRLLADTVFTEKKLQVTNAGDVSTPDIAFFPDTDTGLYQLSPGDSTLAISAGGTYSGHFSAGKLNLKSLESGYGVFYTSLISDKFLARRLGAAGSVAFGWEDDTDTGMVLASVGGSLQLHVGGATRLGLGTTSIYPAVPLQADNGSESAPRYSFLNQTGTGVYRAGTNTLDFSVNGTRRGYFDANSDLNVVGDVLAGPGSATNPSHSFIATPGVGTYRYSATQLGFGSGGSIVGYTNTSLDGFVATRRFEAGLAGSVSACNFRLTGVNTGVYVTATDVGFASAGVLAGYFNSTLDLILAADLDVTSGNVTVTDEVYGVAWNGSVQVPTKNALYDKIETISSGAADGYFYGVVVKQVDYSSGDIASFSDIKVVSFDNNSFYVTQNSTNTDEVIVNFRGTAGGGGSGETNTMSNIGAGAGVYYQKTGVDFEMKSLKSQDSTVSVTNDVNEIFFSATGTFYTPVSIEGADPTLTVGSGASTDSILELYDSGALAYTLGLDDSSASFKLASGVFNGTNDIIEVTSGVVSVTGDVRAGRVEAGIGSFYTSLGVDGWITTWDDAYAAGWNGSLQVPTKNAVYDQIETVSAHASSDGSSHTFIDQDVTSGSSPTFTGTNFTGIPETGITDGALLARVADNETIAGTWTFTGNPSISNTAPTLTFTDTTASATDWTITVDTDDITIAPSVHAQANTDIHLNSGVRLWDDVPDLTTATTLVMEFAPTVGMTGFGSNLTCIQMDPTVTISGVSAPSGYGIRDVSNWVTAATPIASTFALFSAETTFSTSTAGVDLLTPTLFNSAPQFTATNVTSTVPENFGGVYAKSFSSQPTFNSTGASGALTVTLYDGYKSSFSLSTNNASGTSTVTLFNDFAAYASDIGSGAGTETITTRNIIKMEDDPNPNTLTGIYSEIAKTSGGKISYFINHTGGADSIHTGDFYIRSGIYADYADFNTVNVHNTIEVADDVYGAGWDGSLQVPTKNAVYDKIQTVVSAGGGIITLAESEAGGGVWTPTQFNVDSEYFYISTAGATGVPVISLNNPPFIHITKTSAAQQNIGGATGTTTYISWNEQQHVGSSFSHSTSTNNTRVTINESGRYSVLVNVAAANGGGGRIKHTIFLRYDGSTIDSRGKGSNYTRGNIYGDAITLRFESEKIFTAGQYIEAAAYVNYADAVYTANTVDAQCELILRKIG